MAGLSDDRRSEEARARVESALDTAALEAARDAARRTALIAAGGYFLLLLFLLIGVALYKSATKGRLDRSELRAGERAHLQRDRANVPDARQYLLMVAITQAPRA